MKRDDSELNKLFLRMRLLRSKFRHGSGTHPPDGNSGGDIGDDSPRVRAPAQGETRWKIGAQCSSKGTQKTLRVGDRPEERRPRGTDPPYTRACGSNSTGHAPAPIRRTRDTPRHRAGDDEEPEQAPSGPPRLIHDHTQTLAWERAATGDQAKGSCLPSLVDPYAPYEEHVKAALTTNVMDIAFSQYEKQEYTDTMRATMSRDIVDMREAAMKKVLFIASKLEASREQLDEKLPAQHPAKGIHIPLLMHLARKYDYPDRKVVTDILSGMRITGDIADSNVLTAKSTVASVSSAQLERRRRANNIRVCKWILDHADDSTLVDEIWAKTTKEVERGWLSPLKPLTRMDMNATFLSPRFAVRQRRDKIRLIDNFKMSQVNRLASMHETYCPQGLSHLLCSARALHREGASELRIFTLDIRNAFKTIPLHAGDEKFATIATLCPTTGAIFLCTSKVLPFGARASPLSWGRVVTFLQFLLRKALHVHTGAYVDDIHAIEPAHACEAGFDVTSRFLEVTGFTAEPEKCQTPRPVAALLGAKVAAMGDSMVVSADRDRIDSVVATIQAHLDENRLTSGDAAKLRGKLSFVCSLAYGRVGRGAMNELMTRQYRQTSASSLSVELRDSLLWWKATLPALPPRNMPLGPTTGCCVYTDAQGFGHLGAYVVNDHEAWYVSTHAPEWALEKYGIFEFELLAAWLGVEIAIRHASPGRILLFVDNEGAHHAIVRGASRNLFGAHVAQALWRTAAMGHRDHGIIMWTDYVHTKSNIADIPSRMCGHEEPAPGAQPHGWQPARNACCLKPEDTESRDREFKTWCQEKGIRMPARVEPPPRWVEAVSSKEEIVNAARGTANGRAT